MHPSELVELAALVADGAEVLLRTTPRLSATSLEQYWVASKCRFDRWARRLKALAAQSAELGDAPSPRPPGPPPRAVFEEILASEVLTRVWSAVLCAHDRRHGLDESEPIARSVLIAQIEARHRVLSALVQPGQCGPEVALRLDHLRRRAERWTDLLIGYLCCSAGDVASSAVDPQRAADFAADFRQQRGRESRQAWGLLRSSLRASLRTLLTPEAANPDLNAAVAAAILAAFPPEVFDSTGRFRSLWLVRLSNAARDAQGLLDELIGPEPGRSRRGRRTTGAPPGLPGNRPRRFDW